MYIIDNEQNTKHKQMKTSIFFLMLIIFFSCRTKKRLDYSKSVVGEYAATNKKRTLIDALKSNYYILNIKLKINEDKTFTKKTCSYIAKGKWFVSSDTFYYKYDTLTWLIDSLNYSKKYIKRKKRIISHERYLVIKGNQLFKKNKVENKNYIEKLIKNKTSR